MRKSLSSLIVLGITLALVFGLSSAFFSDTETSKDNVLQAGSLDLKIDNESFYNGVLSEETSWGLSDLTDQLFFNFTDIKPDDYGEDTISLHAENDYWACVDVKTTKDDDNTCTEPELPDDPTCSEPDGDLTDGELGVALNFIWWADDGDNVLEKGEEVFKGGTGADVLKEDTWVIADSSQSIFPSPGPLQGGKTVYIGKAWCFGTLGQSPLAQDDYPEGPAGDNDGNLPAGTPEDGGYTCEGTALNNATQSDIFMGDIKFSAYQARHNESFSCVPVTPSVSVSLSPTTTPTPTPLACQQADVMLVLDKSGSIDSTELTQLKTAAKDFVDALGLSTLGIHAGFTSFATLGSLDQHLIDNGTTVKNAVDLLTTPGGSLSFTNLKAGIDLATGEFANPGDGHDRVDLSSPDKMIVITDGQPNRPLDGPPPPDVDAANAADAARSAGIEVYVVGVGSDVDATYLTNEIADDASHYFSVADYSALQTTLQNLDLCD